MLRVQVEQGQIPGSVDFSLSVRPSRGKGCERIAKQHSPPLGTELQVPEEEKCIFPRVYIHCATRAGECSG